MSDPQAQSPQQASPQQPQSGPETSSPPPSLPQDPEHKLSSGNSFDDAVEEALAQFQPKGDSDGRDNRSTQHDNQLDDGHARRPVLENERQEPVGEKDGTAASRESEKDAVKSGPRSAAWATFHKQQRDHQEKVAAFAAEKAELNKFKEAISNAKVDRLAALELLGYDNPRDFIEGIAEDGGRMTPERRELYELKKWKEQQEVERKKYQEQTKQQQEQQQAQQRLDTLRTNVVNTIKGSYAEGLVSMPGGTESVLAQMDQMVTDNPGTMPRIEDAIVAVEKQYATQLAALLEHPKVRAVAEEHLASMKSPQKATAPSYRPVTRTIGQDTTARSVATRDDYVPTLSGDREVEEAIARFSRARGI